MTITAPRSTAAFAYVTLLFFAFGFVTSNNDPLIAALRGIYSLSYTEALLTQFAFFAAYGIVSLPAAALLDRLGFSRTILASLGLMIAACLSVLIASSFQTYALVLVSLFLLASGITALQVAANPLAAALGVPERSHFRLTLAQAFNSMGVVLGVHVGSTLMLGGVAFEGAAAGIAPAARAGALAAVDRAFVTIAAMLAALAALIWVSRKVIDSAAPLRSTGVSSPLAALRARWAVWGAVAIFLYVGAEVSIGSVMINFLNRPEVMALSLEDAGWYLGWVYWFGALIGRFVGSWLLTRIAATRLLVAAAAIAAALSGVAFTAGGPVAAWAALSVGLFNSIMFPTIFTLTLERSTAPSSATSGLLCLAIVGGAFLPLLSGYLADQAGVATAFVVPAIAYLGVVLFAVAAHGAAVVTRSAEPAVAH